MRLARSLPEVSAAGSGETEEALANLSVERGPVTYITSSVLSHQGRLVRADLFFPVVSEVPPIGSTRSPDWARPPCLATTTASVDARGRDKTAVRDAKRWNAGNVDPPDRRSPSRLAGARGRPASVEAFPERYTTGPRVDCIDGCWDSRAQPDSRPGRTGISRTGSGLGRAAGGGRREAAGVVSRPSGANK
ncbi:hypothetical protein JHW43_005028 [Diplocarpon mali]|nr:hypothetical protein JHW43_005028 [Diplocarpon mali]